MHFVTYNIHNILTDGAKAYTYSTRNQQKTYSDEDTSASYTYYYDGLRKSKTVGTNTTYFIWHNGNMVYEFTPTNSNSYTYGHRLISSDDAKYVLNAHGDVVVLLKDVEYEDLWHEGEDGNNLYVTYTVTEVVKRYDYDAFGNELNIDTTDTNPFRYCAEYFDTETGTIYLRARYYSPVTGRFTQLDPIKDGLNWYAYCVNNPVMFVDPSGTYYIRKLKNGNYKLEPETVWTTLSYTFFTPITHLYFRDIKSVVAGTSYVSDESMFYDA
ncbi:MAG: RHS repeat-associated core domain-containing protein, partial [Clostridia bacterium]|nr:RHS repeat-associated core domain-containing protein [Clostridia bacterium]